MADTLGKLMGKADLICEANPSEPDPFPFVVADASRLRGLGWQPVYDLKQGLEKLLKT